MAVATYRRPKELLALPRQDTVPPNRHTLQHCLSSSLPAGPTRGHQQDCKTHAFSWVPSGCLTYLPKFITVLATVKTNETPWSVRYSSLFYEVRHSAKRWGLEDRVTPHQHYAQDTASIRLESFELWTRFGSEEHGHRCRQVKGATDCHAFLARAKVGVEQPIETVHGRKSIWDPLLLCF